MSARVRRPYGTISDAVKYGVHVRPMRDGPLRDDQWPEERSSFITEKERDRERKAFSRQAQQISYSILPTFSFMQTVRVPRKPSRLENDKSS